MKRVAVIDAKAGITAKMNSIAISAGRRLRDVRASLVELPMKEKEWNKGDYLRITVDLEKPQLGLADKVRERFPLALDVQVALPKLEEGGGSRWSGRRRWNCSSVSIRDAKGRRCRRAMNRRF